MSRGTVEPGEQQQISARFLALIESTGNSTGAIDSPAAFAKGIQVKSGEEIDSPAYPMATESQSGIHSGARINPRRDNEPRTSLDSRRRSRERIDAKLCVNRRFLRGVLSL
jgi:hypothetical protein